MTALKRGMTIGVVLFLLFGLTVHLTGSKMKTFEGFLKSGQFKAAEEFCRMQSARKQPTFFIKLGDALLEQRDIDGAARCYEKARFKEGFDRIAGFYFSEEKYQQAAEYYKKGTDGAGLALTYGRIADGFRADGDAASAKKYYDAAITQYEQLIKTFNNRWMPEHDGDWKRCINERNKFPKTQKEIEDGVKLSVILKKSADYCSRLRQACIYFFCRELITVDVSNAKNRKNSVVIFASGRTNKRPRRRTRNEKRSYTYEYQLIREKPREAAIESRILLEENGKKIYKKNAPLLTRYYRHEKILYGPIGLLSSYWQRFYLYRYLGDEMLEGVKTSVIEAIPWLERGQNTLFGKIWVKADDYSIVKIQWYPQSVTNIRNILEMAEAYREKPEVTFISEFNKERGGIRFPSRFYAEEAYVNNRGKKFVRVKVDVTYDDYKFFNVQIGEIKYEGEG
jgi:hypothetical protein